MADEIAALKARIRELEMCVVPAAELQKIKKERADLLRELNQYRYVEAAERRLSGIHSAMSEVERWTEVTIKHLKAIKRLAKEVREEDLNFHDNEEIHSE